VGTQSLAELIRSLDAASALIHAPTEEAFGLVVAEALSRNLKFFGTMVGGLPDVASGVECVELFPPNNRRALVTAIASWLHAGSPRPTTAADEMRRRFDPYAIAKRQLDIYREVASNGD